MVGSGFFTSRRSMSIKAVCECGKKFQAKDEYEGRRAICPSCRREFVFQRDGLPVFHEIIEPSPIQTEVEKPEPEETTATRQRFWKEPIIAFGWGIPVLAFVGFCEYLAWPQARPKHPVAQGRNVGFPRRNPKIPVEVSYSIMEEVIGYGGTRRSVDVSLNGRVSEDVLREIAMELKAAETAQYRDGRMWFYLPAKVQTWNRAIDMHGRTSFLIPTASLTSALWALPSMRRSSY
jgi:hypothetical protein